MSSHRDVEDLEKTEMMFINLLFANALKNLLRNDTCIIVELEDNKYSIEKRTGDDFLRIIKLKNVDEQLEDGTVYQISDLYNFKPLLQ